MSAICNRGQRRKTKPEINEWYTYRADKELGVFEHDGRRTCGLPVVIDLLADFGRVIFTNLTTKQSSKWLTHDTR